MLTALGVVQRDATPASTEAALKLHGSKEGALARAMELGGQVSPTLTVSTITSLAQEVLTMAQIIAEQIDKLPGANLTEAEQLSTLSRLDEGNTALGNDIVATVALAETLHDDVCSALERLSRDRLADQLVHSQKEHRPNLPELRSGLEGGSKQ
jgi:hypothetical protein